MALASMRVNIISRGKGKSSGAAAAYRSGEELYCEYTDQTYFYPRKHAEVIHSQIFLPENAPERLKDRAVLWNEVEWIEPCKNSQLAREIRIALPRELSRAQQITLSQDYTQALVKMGMVADISMHDKGAGNPHAHILLTTRPFNNDGTWGFKSHEEYVLDAQGEKIRGQNGRYQSHKVCTTDWNTKEALLAWRNIYQDITNKHLEKAGVDVRISVESYEKQGIEKEPTVHLGHYAHQLEQQGIATKLGNLNRDIAARNQLRETFVQKFDAWVQTAKETLKQEAEKLAAQQQEIHRQVAASVVAQTKTEAMVEAELQNIQKQEIAQHVATSDHTHNKLQRSRESFKPNGWKIKAQKDWQSVRKLRTEKAASERLTQKLQPEQQRQVVLDVAAQKKPWEQKSRPIERDRQSRLVLTGRDFCPHGKKPEAMVEAELQTHIAQLFTAWKSLVREEVKPQELGPPGPLQTLRTILGTCRDTLHHVQHRLVEAAKNQLEGIAKQLGDRKEAIFEQVTKLDMFHQQSPARLTQQDLALIEALREKVAGANIAHAHEIPESIQEMIRDLKQKEENIRQSAVLHTLEHVVETQLQTLHHERTRGDTERSRHYAESVRSIREKRVLYNARHQENRMEKSSPENRIPEWQRELVEQSLQVEYEKAQPVYVNTLLFSRGTAYQMLVKPPHHERIARDEERSQHYAENVRTVREKKGLYAEHNKQRREGKWTPERAFEPWQAELLERSFQVEYEKAQLVYVHTLLFSRGTTFQELVKPHHHERIAREEEWSRHYAESVRSIREKRTHYDDRNLGVREGKWTPERAFEPWQVELLERSFQVEHEKVQPVYVNTLLLSRGTAFHELVNPPHHERIAREDERSHHYAESVRSIREKRSLYDDRNKQSREGKWTPEQAFEPWQAELLERSFQVEHEKVQPVYVNTLLLSRGTAFHELVNPPHHERIARDEERSHHYAESVRSIREKRMLYDDHNLGLREGKWTPERAFEPWQAELLERSFQVEEEKVQPVYVNTLLFSRGTAFQGLVNPPHHDRIAREDERSHHYAESVRSIREKRMLYDTRHQEKRMEKSSLEPSIPEWQRELVERSLESEYAKAQPFYVNALLFSQHSRHLREKLPEEPPLASSRELVLEAEQESPRPTHTKPQTRRMRQMEQEWFEKTPQEGTSAIHTRVANRRMVRIEPEQESIDVKRENSPEPHERPETRRTVRIAPEQESPPIHARTFRARGRERDRSP